MSKRDTDPPREIVEKFSVQWYIRELQELFTIAADAKRNSEPEFDQIARLLQELSINFLQPAQIQQHHADHVIDAYRTKVAGLQPGTEEFFSTVEIGRWLRVCQEALANGQSPAEISRLVIPLIEQKLSEFGLAVVTIEPEPAAPVEPIPAKPVATVPTKAPHKRSSIHPGMVAAGVALAGGLYGGYKLVEHFEQSAVADKELWSHQYDHIPSSLRDHLVGVPKAASETVPHPQAGELHDWGERKVWFEPDGSQLYIPTATEYNKAFMLPAHARGNIDWRGIRYPVQVIQEMGLQLQADGLWHSVNGDVFAVLDAGHLLSIGAGSSIDYFLPFNQTNQPDHWKRADELAAYYASPIDLSSIDTTIAPGFVDVEAQPGLQTIQCDLSYRSYDNTAAGVPIYPLDYKCQIPESYVADLAAVEAELTAHGYHLGIGDAKRPYIVQQFLYDTLPKWSVADPDNDPPHVAGRAMDVTLLDDTYIPVLASGFKPLPDLAKASKSLRSPKNKEEALQNGWLEEEYDKWKFLSDTFAAHGFQFIRSERWHVEYTK